jgi:hypothetical protein
MFEVCAEITLNLSTDTENEFLINVSNHPIIVHPIAVRSKFKQDKGENSSQNTYTLCKRHQLQAYINYR